MNVDEIMRLCKANEELRARLEKAEADSVSIDQFDRLNQDRIHLSLALIRMAKWRDLCLDRIAALASARHAPAQEQGEALVRIISAELHRLPNNNKGHEIGMMEVGYDSNGQLNYGPLWLSVDETDAILLGIYRALLARKPSEERGPEAGK